MPYAAILARQHSRIGEFSGTGGDPLAGSRSGGTHRRADSLAGNGGRAITLKDAERAHIIRTLRATNGVIAAAAVRLGFHARPCL